MSGYSCRSDVICHSSELHRPGPGKGAGFTLILIRNTRPLQAARQEVDSIRFPGSLWPPAAARNKSGTKQMEEGGAGTVSGEVNEKTFSYRSDCTTSKWWVFTAWLGRLFAVGRPPELNLILVLLVVTWHWLDAERESKGQRTKSLALSNEKKPLEKSPCQHGSTARAWIEIM